MTMKITKREAEALEDPSPLIPKYRQRNTFIIEFSRREKCFFER